MPNTSNPSSSSRQPAGPTSAPDLPAHIAKQYGLHHHTPASKQVVKSLNTEDPNVDNPLVDAAVEDIVAAEGDALLDAQDGKVPQLTPAARSFWDKIGHFFMRWWRNAWARWITIGVLVVLVSAIVALPQSRYWVLNTVGVRSTASVKVLDETTHQPLKNVTVSLGNNMTTTTDKTGVARFRDLKLGPYDLTVRRLAFASQKQRVTIGWGSNPLGNFELQATGVQYTVFITDYLSGKPLAQAEALNDGYSAVSDKNGKVILTMEDTDSTTLPVTVAADGYLSKDIVLNATANETPTIALVPARKHVFISKDSGKFDVYTSNLDGQERKLLLAGTGNEGNNLSLVTNTSGEKAAMVSTRDGLRDFDGFALSTLTFIDTQSGAITTVERGVQIQLVDWSTDRLVYKIALPGASAANPQRYRLVAYNPATNAKLQLATANEFTTILAVDGMLYYAASSNDPKATMGLFRVKTDGTSREKVVNQEIWTGFRATHNTLSLQTPDAWFTYTVNNNTAARTTAPASFAPYLFLEGTHNKSIWVDTRDGKGTLLLHDNETNTDKVLAAQDGLGYPVSWVGDKAIVFRVATNKEVADYVVSPAGGQARKLSDVTPAYGLTQGN